MNINKQDTNKNNSKPQAQPQQKTYFNDPEEDDISDLEMNK